MAEGELEREGQRDLAQHITAAGEPHVYICTMLRKIGKPFK